MSYNLKKLIFTWQCYGYEKNCRLTNKADPDQTVPLGLLCLLKDFSLNIQGQYERLDDGKSEEL